MKRRAIVSEVAEKDIRDARRWYAARDRDLGHQFVLDVRAAVRKAAAFPEAVPEVEPDIRSVLCKKFPYKVYYTLEDQQVVVLAVYHTSRDPKRWNDPNR